MRYIEFPGPSRIMLQPAVQLLGRNWTSHILPVQSAEGGFTTEELVIKSHTICSSATDCCQVSYYRAADIVVDTIGPLALKSPLLALVVWMTDFSNIALTTA